VRLSELKGWSDDVREPEERLIVLPLSGLVSRREAAVPDVSASSPAALIPVGALRDARSLRKALEECAKKIRNPASLRDGNTLRLAFQTPDGTVSEATFFAAVTGKKACLKPLAAYVEGLIALRPGEPLWQDSETSAGAYAVRALVLSERRFLPVLRRYLKSPIVDLDHAVGYPGSILDEALKKYGWGPDLLGIVAAVGATGTQFATEFSKSLAQDKDFLVQLSKGRNRATFKAALLEEAEGDPRRISNSLLDLANGAPP
jgi:hypothetical protein